MEKPDNTICQKKKETKTKRILKNYRDIYIIQQNDGDKNLIMYD